MRHLDRPALLNLTYYAGVAATLAAAALAFALGHTAALVIAAACCAGWAVGALALMWLFEPALARWCEAEAEDREEAAARALARRSARAE